MNSRVTLKDAVSMILIVVSFVATAVMIKNEDYEYALIALTFAAFCVMIGFIVLIVEDGDKILDLSNPNLRNPGKSNSGKRVQYISRLTPDMMGKKKTKTSKTKSKYGNSDFYMEGLENDFYESVGNMKVYKRGEKIEYHNDED